MIRIVLLGTGNVAKHLFDAFSIQKDVKIDQVYGRNQKSLDFFKKEATVTTDIKKIKDADVYIIAISDDAIEKLSNELENKKGIVVHTSGSVPLTALSNKNRRGVFYPLQTFSLNKKVDFKMVPVCIEAENEGDYALLNQLASTISENVSGIDSEQRKSLHLAAVFVNNFPNHIYHITKEICDEKNVSFDLLKPLITETSEKLEELSPYDAQTGPARRNDLGTIQRHLDLLDNKAHKKIYSTLSKSIQKAYGKKL